MPQTLARVETHVSGWRMDSVQTVNGSDVPGTAFDCSKLHVTIVDDSPYFRLLLRAMLRGRGVQHIYEAGNAEEALRQLRQYTPDILLTDVLMPKIDGTELVWLIRNDPNLACRGMPIVCVSGDPGHDTVMRAISAGADGFLVKPMSASRPYSQIERCLTKPLPRIKLGTYYGPDCRRRSIGPPGNVERRGIKVEI